MGYESRTRSRSRPKPARGGDSKDHRDRRHDREDTRRPHDRENRERDRGDRGRDRRDGDEDRRRDVARRDASRRSDSRQRGRDHDRDRGRDDAADGDDQEDPSFKVTIEGPNQTHCYRATVEMVKPDKSDCVSGSGGAGRKMRVTAAWQGDKRSAQRDLVELQKAWRKGGFDQVYKRKTELRDKAVGR